MKTQDKEQKKCRLDCTWKETELAGGTDAAHWDSSRETEASEELVAALRGYFLTHTFDPLTGEIHTIH